MVNRDVVGAHYGLRDWLVQRVTAVIMAICTLIVLVSVLRLPQADFSAWRALFAAGWMKITVLLFLVCVFWHAWVGVRNIFMDYIKSNALRLVLHVAAIAWLIVCAAWSVQILWGVK